MVPNKLCHVCPSVCQRGATRPSLDGYQTFLHYIPVLVKIRQKWQELYEKSYTHLSCCVTVHDIRAENVKGESCLIANPMLMYREIMQHVLHYTSEVIFKMYYLCFFQQNMDFKKYEQYQSEHHWSIMFRMYIAAEVWSHTMMKWSERKWPWPNSGIYMLLLGRTAKSQRRWPMTWPRVAQTQVWNVICHAGLCL